MVIHLFNDESGLITGTENYKVETTPQTEGRLFIGQTYYGDEKNGYASLEEGTFPAQFRTDDKTWDLGNVKVENGKITPFHKPTYTELKVLEKNDELENKITALEQEVENLKGKVEQDALDFLK